MANYKYEQVAENIKGKILSAAYKPGSKLPSIKMLAGELSLNTDTIVKAYKLLESQHFIYSVAKSGYYVMKSTSDIQPAIHIIDMLTVNPAAEVNPYKDFCHCMEKAVSLYEHKLFAYSPPKGMPELISVLKKHMVNYQIFPKEQDIFITTGAQQALFILALTEFPNGDTILVEQPTYDVMLEIINTNNVPVIGINRTAAGIDLAKLERIFSQNRIKFFYLMPRFQNPTGYSYTNQQKKEILRLARIYNVYIVEDDYLADMEINPKNDPFAAFDTNGSVIYVKSFSKNLLTGLRLGMVILPEPLHDRFIRRKHAIDLNTSVLSQGAMEIYLRSSMYEAHIKRTKAHYKKKMDILRKECTKELEDMVNFFIPATGIFAYIETENHLEEYIISALGQNGLKAMGTNSFYLNDSIHPGGIRLCTCKAEEKSIPRSVQIIKDTFAGLKR